MGDAMFVSKEELWTEIGKEDYHVEERTAFTIACHVAETISHSYIMENLIEYKASNSPIISILAELAHRPS